VAWSQLIDALSHDETLSALETEALFAAVFDGGVPELELGAILALMERREVSPPELFGAMSALSARAFRAALPDTQWRPVVLPAYVQSRTQADALPLLAMSLQRFGIPVLVHGELGAARGIATSYILREFGILPAASLSQAQQLLDAGRVAFVPTGALAPGLADLVSLRVRLGGGVLARMLARLVDPFQAGALHVCAIERSGEAEAVSSVLLDAERSALLFESPDGSPVVDVRRRPGIVLVAGSETRALFEAESAERSAHAVPSPQDVKGTVDWIRGILEGRIPMPAPVANQLACCLYGAAYAQDFNQAKAIAAIETGSLAVA